MYILRISFKAFIKLEQNGDIVIVNNINKATLFNDIRKAMQEIIRVNSDLETDKIHIFPV